MKNLQNFSKNGASGTKFWALCAQDLAPPIPKYWRGRIRDFGRIGGGGCPPPQCPCLSSNRRGVKINNLGEGVLEDFGTICGGISEKMPGYLVINGRKEKAKYLVTSAQENFLAHLGPRKPYIPMF